MTVPASECPLCDRIGWTDVCLGIKTHQEIEEHIERLMAPFGGGDRVRAWLYERKPEEAS